MLALTLCRFVETTAAVLLTGSVVLRLLASGTALGPELRWTRLAAGSWGVVVLAAALQFALTAQEMSGQPFRQALSGEVLASVLHTHFGMVWKVRLGLLAALLAAGLARTASQRRRPAWVSAAVTSAGGLLVAGLLASLVWAGHAQASSSSGWLLPGDIVHVLAAGCWPGGLWPLALLLARARHDPGLIPVAVTITRRFSRLSMAAVGILALSGLLNGCGLVGTWAALWTSAYGRLLLGKVTLFAALIGLGAVNRRLTRGMDAGNAAQTLRRLWRNVSWECMLAVGVLLATEALAMTAPPAVRM